MTSSNDTLIFKQAQICIIQLRIATITLIHARKWIICIVVIGCRWWCSKRTSTIIRICCPDAIKWIKNLCRIDIVIILLLMESPLLCL